MKILILSTILCVSQLVLAQNQTPQRRFIGLPLVYYTPDTSLAFGGLGILNIAKVSEGKTSNLTFSGSYTLREQSLFFIDPHFYFLNGDLELSGTVFYRFFPSDYYGRGNHTAKEAKQKYTENSLLYGADFKYSYLYHHFVGFHYYLSNNKVVDADNTGSLATELQSGFGEYTQTILGVILGWDSRVYPRAPLDGAYYKITVDQLTTNNQDGLIRYTQAYKYEVDLRQYIPVGDKKVVALQAFTGRFDGRDIPFQNLYRVGGGSRLRGYLGGRFRDKTIVLSQAEYRFDFAEKWAAAFFAGAAAVSPSYDSWPQQRRWHSIGAGIHYLADAENRTKLRVDIGVGEDERGFYVLFGEAF